MEVDTFVMFAIVDPLRPTRENTADIANWREGWSKQSHRRMLCVEL